MKKTNTGCNYVLFAGETKNDLYPIAAYSDKDEAIDDAKVSATLFKCVEVTYMPEDNDDINEVVWSNCGRR